MNQPMVALTDFLITALSFYFSYWFWCQGQLNGIRANFIGLFASIAAASLLGGIVHGFLPLAEEPVRQIFWVLTLLSVGFSSYNIWMINLHLLNSHRLMSVGRMVARVMFALYVIVLLSVTQEFYIAIISYIPATFVLMLLILSRVARHRARADIYGILGLILTFVAAYIQQARLVIHPVYFDHNVLYHVVQAVGLTGLFVFAKELPVKN